MDETPIYSYLCVSEKTLALGVSLVNITKLLGITKIVCEQSELFFQKDNKNKNYL